MVDAAGLSPRVLSVYGVRMMRIIILGGTGFIGSHVTAYLARAGHDLTIFHRGQTESHLSTTVARIHGDRQNLPALRGEFERLRPQIVIDMIPFTEHDARTVMDTFSGVAERVIAISSMDVYRAYGHFIRLELGPPETGPLTEEAPLRERLYPYREQAKGLADMAFDYEKILVERAVLHHRELPGMVLRLPKVYGPGDAKHHLFEYLKRMDDHRPAILLEEGQALWRWTRGYVENVAAAIALAATKKGCEHAAYNVGEEVALTESEWVGRIGESAGWQGQIKSVPGHLLPHHLTLSL
jgi:nucleoside-diphosphate-sugar epimerase